ncbi:hypothetical protein SAMN05421858_1095 [Haladaptatus litoreus]|uniref:Uncharacterized protein n=1 Tax=Haladaptatus litoreus TaxID=553468 RepID=A0A1N6XDW9_9EURY|nr:hypothetical protein [Haladaptatus litoreus]SIR00546.1 hypothetical protein SAMN05421858_1095 [Haladaptatus litoreus]
MDGTVGIDARTVFAWLLVLVLAILSWLFVEPFLSWLLATGFLAFVFFPLHRRLENRIGARLSAGLVIWGVTPVAVTDDYLRAVIIDQQSETHSAVVFLSVVGGTTFSARWDRSSGQFSSDCSKRAWK